MPSLSDPQLKFSPHSNIESQRMADASNKNLVKATCHEWQKLREHAGVTGVIL